MSVDSGATASYAYDHQNRRYKATVGGTVTHYVWQREKVLAEHNGSSGALIVNYIYAGSRVILSLPYYLLSDRLSVRLILNTSGTVKGRQGHLPFGEDFAETGPQQQKQHFTSYERDSQIGTDYAVNRTYSFAIGRFQSADPFQSSNDASAPQSWNRYAYVENSPGDFIDPIGLLMAAPPPPDTCGGHPPINDTGGDNRETPTRDPFKGVTVKVSWKIAKSSRSKQGELATCGKFDLTIEIRNVPVGNPDNISVSEVKAGNYPAGSIRLVGEESVRQTGRTITYNATYQVGNIIAYQGTGNLGLKIILGANVKAGPDDPIVLVTTDANRLGHDDDYIAIRGTIPPPQGAAVLRTATNGSRIFQSQRSGEDRGITGGLKLSYP